MRCCSIADDYEVGDTATHYFTVRDDDGNYYGGAAISVVDSYGPDGLLFVPLIDDLSTGLYRVTWEVAEAGVYTLRLLADLSPLGDDNQLFEFESRVLPSAQDAESPFAPVLGPTLEDLIREVALLCRDYARTVASEDSTDGATWRDDLNFAARSPKSFKGASLFVLTAAGAENVDARCGSVTPSRARADPDPGAPLDGAPGRPGLPDQPGVGRVHPRELQRSLNDRISDTLSQRAATGGLDLPYALRPGLSVPEPPVEFTHLSSVGYPLGAWTPMGGLHPPVRDPRRQRRVVLGRVPRPHRAPGRLPGQPSPACR